jgi:DNA replication protein DnaC
MMERAEVLDMMGTLKLFGMRAAYDETLAVAIKRRHEPQKFAGDLLKAEIAEKQARSIKYQLAIARLPLAKDIDEFDFAGTPINEALVRDLAGGGFIAQQRNAVLVGGTGTGKSHLAIAIARSCIASAPAPAPASSPPSISSIASKPKPAPVGKGASPITSPASISLSSTNSAICPSPRPAANCRSI